MSNYSVFILNGLWYPNKDSSAHAHARTSEVLISKLGREKSQQSVCLVNNILDSCGSARIRYHLSFTQNLQGEWVNLSWCNIWRQIWQRTLSMFSIKISFINNLQLKVHVFTFPRNSKLRYSLWPELFLCDKNMVHHLRPHPNVSHSTQFIFQNCFLMKPKSHSNNKKND